MLHTRVSIDLLREVLQVGRLQLEKTAGQLARRRMKQTFATRHISLATPANRHSALVSASVCVLRPRNAFLASDSRAVSIIALESGFAFLLHAVDAVD